MENKFFLFLALCAFVIGTVGSVGLALSQGSWVIAICELIVAVMALPMVKDIFDSLQE